MQVPLDELRWYMLNVDMCFPWEHVYIASILVHAGVSVSCRFSVVNIDNMAISVF